MKYLLIAFALISVAAAASLPDSATQGPNPQDIATPEPEYIDIDLPEPAPKPVSAPHPSYTAPRFIQYPIQTSYGTPFVQHAPQPKYVQQIPGHHLGPSGYQYRRPVYIRRFYRHRY